MRERLCSSWTVTLNYQTLIVLADALRRLETDRAAKQERWRPVLEEFQRVLIADDVLAGLAYFHEGGKPISCYIRATVRPACLTACWQ